MCKAWGRGRLPALLAGSSILTKGPCSSTPLESAVAKPGKAGSQQSLSGRNVGECLPFFSRFSEPRSQKKASTCCARTALSIYLLLLTAGQGLLMYKGNATASPWAWHQKRALLVLLGARARGNEHTDLKPPRQQRGSSAHRQAEQWLQGTILPLCVCASHLQKHSQLRSWLQQGLPHENHLPGSNRGGLYPPRVPPRC